MEYNPRQKLIEKKLSNDDFKRRLCLMLAGGKEYEKVVWSASESEVVVHLKELKVAIRSGKIVVGLSMECDEFGVQELVLPFVIGEGYEDAFLLAVMPKSFGGHRELGRSWGDIAARFVWQACIDAVQSTWNEREELDPFEVHGMIGDNKEIRGLFAYPEDGDVLDGKDTGKESIADLVDSLDVAQIYLGLWENGPLTPEFVDKVNGRVDVVKFTNGIEMKGADVAALIKEKKVKVNGVTAVRKGDKLFLRAKPDKSFDNNLLKLKKIPR